jgi:hypothetical protein
MFCLFICFESHEQFFSDLATVTNAGDRAAKKMGDFIEPMAYKGTNFKVKIETL